MPLSWQENKSSPSPCWFMDRGRQYKHPAVVFASKDKGQEFKWRKLHIKLDSQGSGTCFMFFYNSNSSQRFLWHQSMCFTVVCFSMVSLVNWRWFFPGPPRDGLLTLLLRLRLLSIGFLFFNERRNSHIGVSMSFFRFSHWERLRFGGNFFRGWNCSVQVCVYFCLWGRASQSKSDQRKVLSFWEFLFSFSELGVCWFLQVLKRHEIP